MFQKKLSEELGAGEKLLWFGRPNPLRYAVQQAWYTVPFGLIFAGTAAPRLLNPETAPRLGYIGYQDVIAILFVFIGLIIASTPIRQYFEAKNLIFFITEKRAGKIFSFPRRRVWSLPKQDLGPYEKQQLSGGLASIFFSTKVVSDAEGKTYLKQGFVAIADVNEVEGILMGIAHQNAA